jgi:hypothetical protein
VVLSVHAEGAQVYECKAGADGKLGWAFREPIATLLAEGKTIGRHYAGPSWEHSDGSAVVGKAVGNAPGANTSDIPWLKLEVASRRGSGILSDVTTVQRINTVGGKLDGACDKAGTFKSAPYSADYVFCARARPPATTVIPGWSVSTRPGISRFRVRCGACHRAGQQAGPVGIAPE